jgi:hypothetical protein
MARGGKRASAYANNPLWDVNKDGVVREGEFGTAAMKALGAGKHFSVGGATVSPTNPLPVALMGGKAGFGTNASGSMGGKAAASLASAFYGPGFDLLSGRMDAEGFGADAAMGGKAAITLPQGSIVAGSLTEVALAAMGAAENVNKLGDGAELTAEQMAENRRLSDLPGKAKKGEREGFSKFGLDREGFAGSFEGNLAGVLGNWRPGQGNPLKAFGMGMLGDIQQKSGAMLSNMLTSALFGKTDDKGNRSGGLLSGLFGSLFGGGGKSGGSGGFLSGLLGSLFGGFRASGGPVSPGSLYVVGERGPEFFMPGAGGQVMNGSQMAGAMAGGEQREQRFIFVDSDREAQRHRSARSENFIMAYRQNRHIINRMGR